MANVVLYTKSYCPYSKNCKDYLDSKKVEYAEKVIDLDKALAHEMLMKAGQRDDTPQVFINEHHIGSFDDMKALDATGNLDEMLNLE